MENQNQKAKAIQLLPVSIIIASVIISGAILYASLTDKQTTTVTNGRQVPKNQGAPAPQGLVKVSVDDDPFLGNENAALTLIEFSDFQCPFCRAFWRDTLPKIKKDYIDNGKLKFVYRDFPLTSIHPAATSAAQAGECAGEQGKFWQMHDKIFEEQDKQGRGTVQFSSQDIKNWAPQIGLNAATFNQCLDSGKYASEVEKDTNDGIAAGVNGTPAFFIGKTSADGTIEGQLVSGAQPFSAFKIIIDEMLSK